MILKYRTTVIPLAAMVILVAGLLTSVYLVQQKTNFTSKASEPKSTVFVPPTLVPPPISTSTPTITPTTTPKPGCSTCSADINRDGTVDNLDYDWFTRCYQKDPDFVLPDGKTCQNSDVDGSGVINSQDGSCIRKNYQKDCHG